MGWLSNAIGKIAKVVKVVKKVAEVIAGKKDC
jgi:hypothetical protein